MTEKTRYEEGVRILKDWYSKQPHLPQEIDENLFYSFVSGTKSLEKSKSKLDAYLTLRNDIFNLFQDIGPTSTCFRENFKYTGVTFLHGTTEEGWKVMFMTPNKFGMAHPDQVLITIMTMVEMVLAIWPTDTAYIVVVDLQWAKASSMGQMSMKRLAAYIKYLTKTTPVKLKKSIIINSPSFMEKIFSFLPNLMSKKALERIQVSKDCSVLMESLSEDMLPSNYGGNGPSLEQLTDYWLDIIESKKDWFNKQSKMVSDESKRPRDSCRKETLDFGVEGSFRLLNID